MPAVDEGGCAQTLRAFEADMTLVRICLEDQASVGIPGNNLPLHAVGRYQEVKNGRAFAGRRATSPVFVTISPHNADFMVEDIEMSG